jgi:hypothetical protein
MMARHCIGAAALLYGVVALRAFKILGLVLREFGFWFFPRAGTNDSRAENYGKLVHSAMPQFVAMILR